MCGSEWCGVRVFVVVTGVMHVSYSVFVLVSGVGVRVV